MIDLGIPLRFPRNRIFFVLALVVEGRRNRAFPPGIFSFAFEDLHQPEMSEEKFLHYEKIEFDFLK